jgi:hypothetical protein
MLVFECCEFIIETMVRRMESKAVSNKNNVQILVATFGKPVYGALNM